MYNRDWDDMWDLLDSPDAQDQPAFIIDNDRKADWAVEKVLDAVAERDRLQGLVKERIAGLMAQNKALDEQCERKTAYLRQRLQDYFATVKPSSESKTQTKYRLSTGNLVLKRQQPEYVRDEPALVEWAEKSASEFVRTEKRVDWAGLKKATVLDGESVCYAETGEVIPGVVAKARDDVFEIASYKEGRT